MIMQGICKQYIRSYIILALMLKLKSSQQHERSMALLFVMAVVENFSRVYVKFRCEFTRSSISECAVCVKGNTTIEHTV